MKKCQFLEIFLTTKTMLKKRCTLYTTGKAGGSWELQHGSNPDDTTIFQNTGLNVEF